MKLSVVVPSAQYLASAGNRVRYQRLREPLARLGCTLDIATVDSLDAKAKPTKKEVFLFSKVQDARGLALAHELRSGGVRVGIDLFDDYFSQIEDARLAPQRRWLENMALAANFFLCSTARMKQVAGRYFGKAPGHVLNDPFERFDRERLGPLLEHKRRSALEKRRIEVLWFGMGDNPSFPVGLHDLAHHGHVLRGFRELGFEIRLKVLTNLRALDRAGLGMLRMLPVLPEVEEWTQARESAALETSLVSFLPVNAQAFSIAKSLNRAVTALTGGTQLLSAGYPLYEPLRDFLYRDCQTLVGDLVSDSLRVSTDTLGAIGKTLDQISSPTSEAEALFAFLNSVAAPGAGPTKREPARLAILHGERSTGAIHKFARQREWLSFGSPLTPIGLSYDAHLAVFEPGGSPALRVTARAAKLLQPQLTALVRPVAGVRDGLALEVRTGALDPGLDALLAGTAAMGHTGARLALHGRVAAATKRIYTEAFGPLHFIDSELSPLLSQAWELESHARRADR